MKRTKLILFILLMLLLWLPVIQQCTGWFREAQLHGAFTVPSKPELNLDSIKALQYQKRLEDYLNNTFGFRPTFVKIKNTWEYALFRQINVSDQVQGKNGYIYSKTSIEKMLGQWYNGSRRNDETVSKINFLKENVEMNGGHFLAIFAPSKESILPEFMPDIHTWKQTDSSDYKDIIAGYKKYNIPYIDFAEYFKKIKNSVEHPLFTTTGFHWTSYAASIAQDSILSYMQRHLADPMPQYKHVGVEWSDTARDSEADFEEPMNLLYSLNQPKYVYPKMEMIPATLKNKRPKVIIIGDSFFWQLKNLKILQSVFSDDSKYWYYFARYSFPLADVPGVMLKELNVMEELQTADYVILVGSFGTTSDFPFGITDYYKDHLYEGTLGTIAAYIHDNPEYMEQLTETAAQQNKPVEALVVNEARKATKNKGSFNLKAMNGKFVCADAARGDIVTADKDVAAAWELFSCYPLDGDHVVLTSFQNKFLSAELNSKQEITANRDKIGAWEVFTKIDLSNNRVAFKASNGKYLTVDPSTLQLMATAEKITGREQFIVVQ